MALVRSICRRISTSSYFGSIGGFTPSIRFARCWALAVRPLRRPIGGYMMAIGRTRDAPSFLPRRRPACWIPEPAPARLLETAEVQRSRSLAKSTCGLVGRQPDKHASIGVQMNLNPAVNLGSPAGFCGSSQPWREFRPEQGAAAGRVDGPSDSA